MDEVFIRTKDLSSWVADLFRQSDIISVEDLVLKLEEVSSELDILRDEFEEYKQYVESNYKELSQAELVE